MSAAPNPISPAPISPAPISPAPAAPQVRTQRLPAAASRLLLSVVLVVACVPLLRLTLAPVPAQAPGSAQRLLQSEPLRPGEDMSLRLDGRWADVRVGGADLGGDLMRGEITLPGGAAVQRTFSRTAGAAESVYAVSAPARPVARDPLRFSFSGHGLTLGASARPGPSGAWTVQVGRQTPAALNISTTSGDQVLDLGAASVSTLRSNTRWGETRVWLPTDRAPTVQLSSQSGDLIVGPSSLGQPAEGGSGGAAPRPPSSIETSSTFGDQQLDLTALGFSQVRARTQAGDLNVQLPGRPGLAAVLSSRSGDVHLGIPAALTRGDVSVQSASGDLDLTLPPGASVRLSVSPPDDLSVPGGYVRQGGAYLSPAARRGEAALQVSLFTQLGSVVVREAGEQP